MGFSNHQLIARLKKTKITIKLKSHIHRTFSRMSRTKHKRATNKRFSHKKNSRWNEYHLKKYTQHIQATAQMISMHERYIEHTRKDAAWIFALLSQDFCYNYICGLFLSLYWWQFDWITLFIVTLKHNDSHTIYL